MVRPLSHLNRHTPYEVITGNTPDISEFLEYSWYQPVWYYEPRTFPRENKQLGRWLGVTHRIGQAMCYCILPGSGVPIARTTIQAVTQMELDTKIFRLTLQELDQQIHTKLNCPLLDSKTHQLVLYREDEDPNDDTFPQEALEPEAIPPDIDDVEPDMCDELVLTEPKLMKDGQLMKARIIGHKRDHDSNLIGHYNANPVLNTRVYPEEFPGGHIQELSANKVVQAIYDHVDDDGYAVKIFHDMISHCKPSNCGEHTGITIKGWEICVSWADGSTSWHTLQEIKNSFPVQLTEYAM